MQRRFTISPAEYSARLRAVSMMEVLTVISILVFLLAMLVPGLNAAREHARRVLCQNNLRQWGVALQLYRDDHNDYIPMEGNTLNDPTTHLSNLFKPGTWFNTLPPYLDMPAYREVEGVNIAIREFKNGHIWICPSKDLTDGAKSYTGKNQFHYGMNQVLDGMGKGPAGSRDTPGFPDPDKAAPLPAKRFIRKPHTVFLFDIAPNSPAGSPRNVATEYFRNFDGSYAGKFHGDYANFLYINGGVAGFQTSAWVEGNDNRHGRIRWENPQLYWGYPPPKP